MTVRWRRPPRMTLAVCAMPLYFLASAFPPAGGSFSFCLFERLTSLPCPGCGITTSVLHLLRGSLRSAIEVNAAGVAVAAFYAVQLTLGLAYALRVATPERTMLAFRTSDRALLAALISEWVFKVLIPRFACR